MRGGTTSCTHQERAPHYNSISFHLHILASTTSPPPIQLVGSKVHLRAAKCENIKVALKLCAGKWISRQRIRRKLVFTFRETQRGDCRVSM